jgi:WD40 repeat protein
LGRQSFITAVAVSGDGRWVATGGDDGKVWLWDREHLETPPLTWLGHESSVNSIAVSQDGRWLMAGQSDGTLMVGAIRVADLKAKACKSAARNLSGAEWQIYLGGEPYHETCPGLHRPDVNDAISQHNGR